MRPYFDKSVDELSPFALIYKVAEARPDPSIHAHPTDPRFLPMRHVSNRTINRESARASPVMAWIMHRAATTAGRLTVPHHFMAIGQPQIRYSDPSLPARPCSLWFAQCFEIANRVQYPRGPLRLRARYLGGAPRTIWLVHSERQRPAGSNCRWAGGGAVGGSACLAGTAAA